MRTTHRNLTDAVIDEILENGNADIAKSDFTLIRSVVTSYVEDIFRRLREHGYDESMMKLYITGGGGCLVRNFYKFNKERVIFIDDICAAAKGYEYMAELQLNAANAV